MSTSSTQAYAPRNLLNVAQLREALIERNSKEADVVQNWLSKHLIRYGQLEFEHVQHIKSLKDLGALSLGAPPDWLIEKLKDGQTFIYIDPGHDAWIETEKACVEWLNSRLGTVDEPKFMRMPAVHVIEKHRQSHARLYEKAQKGFRETTGDALVEILTEGDLTCFELSPKSTEFRQELMNETVMVQHCVGQFEDRKALKDGYGEHYASQSEQGKMRIFSFRTKAGNARITMSCFIEDGVLRLDQIKGKQNRPPAVRYQSVVLKSLQYLKPSSEDFYDMNAVGIIAKKGEFSSVFDESASVQNNYLVRFPDLIDGIANPTPAQLWTAVSQDFRLAKNHVLPDGLQVMISMLDPFLARNLSTFDTVHRQIGRGRATLFRDGCNAKFPVMIEVRR